MDRILIIGPFPKPISGVALSNKVVKNILENSKDFKLDTLNTSYNVFEDAVGSFSLRKLLFYLKINLKVFKIFKNDTIYMTPGQTFFGITKYTFFILVSFIFKKELIIHVHGNYLGKQYQNLRGFKKKIFYFLISKFTKGIVLSNSLKQNLTPFLNEKNIHILYNFAEDFLVENELEVDNSILKISYLSNLMEEKGIFYLLDSLKELENRGVSYKARIAGNIDKNLKGKILNKLSNLKNTTYIGVVYNKDKKELLNWSNVFVLPTFYRMEGQPISILEALATKNVIISTKHAGIVDVIENNKNGFLVNKKDSNSITEQLIKLNANKTKISEICSYNKLYFSNNFTKNIFSIKLLKIIKNNAIT